MTGTITVPFLYVGGYAAFVVVSTLLVGLLPALVDLPICENEEVANKLGKLNENNQHQNSRSIRSAPFDELLNYSNDFEKYLKPEMKGIFKNEKEMREMYLDKHPRPKRNLSENYYLKKKNIALKENQECPEFTYPQLGVTPPWFNNRLPSNVIPIHYEVEMFFPAFYQEEYDGFIVITLKVTEATDTFLIHKKFAFVQVLYMYDKMGNFYDLACDGEFKYNDYYVFKTTNFVQPDLSPLKLAIFFISPLSVYENGIFEIEFETNNKKS